MTAEFRENLPPDEMRALQLRLLRRAITMIETGQANGIVLILTCETGTLRDWIATPHSRRLSGDVAHSLRGLSEFFAGQWAAHTELELDPDLDGGALMSVPDDGGGEA